MEGSNFLVDIGRRDPLVVIATDAHDAAFQSLLHLGDSARPGLLVVRDGDGNVVKLDMSERRCRVCGCTEYKACEGGCCWMGWDVCSRCV